jgi:hypothetical protein
VSNRYVVHLAEPRAGYTPDQLQALDLALQARFAKIPGVQSAGIALYSPLDGLGDDLFYPIYLPGAVSGETSSVPSAHSVALIDRVSPGFFDAVGQSVLVGRGFTVRDTAASQFVAVVNQTFAERFFPGVDPIGRRFGDFGQGYAKTYEIVGIVADATYTNPRNETQPMYFRPLSQWQDGLRDSTEAVGERASHYATSIVMGFRERPKNLESLVRDALHEVDSSLTVADFRALDDQVENNFNQQRLVARLSALFGILTLMLVCASAYGNSRYPLKQRTRAGIQGNISVADRNPLVNAELAHAAWLARSNPASRPAT